MFVSPTLSVCLRNLSALFGIADDGAGLVIDAGGSAAEKQGRIRAQPIDPRGLRVADLSANNLMRGGGIGRILHGLVETAYHL